MSNQRSASTFPRFLPHKIKAANLCRYRGFLAFPVLPTGLERAFFHVPPYRRILLPLAQYQHIFADFDTTPGNIEHPQTTLFVSPAVSPDSHASNQGQRMKYDIRFFLKDPKATKPTPINLHFNYAGQRLKLATGTLCEPKHWNPDKERVKRGAPHEATVNDRLTTLETTVMGIFVELRNKTGKLPTAEAIRQRFRIVGGEAPTAKAVDFFGAFARFIEEMSSKRQPGTIKIYVTIRNHVQAFAKAYSLKMTFEKIDTMFFEKFTGYLVNVKGIRSNNTLWNIYKTLRVFVRWAVEHDLTDNTEYRKLKVAKYEPPVLALSNEELEALRTIDLSDNSRLSNVRDLFLLQCYTGLRYSDLAQLRPEHFSGDTIRLTTTKTREALTIPLLPEAKEILARHPDCGWRIVTNQKMNETLKDLGKRAELTANVETISFCGVDRVNDVVPKWQTLSTHVGRKTFVTLALERGVRPEVVMRVTGHKDLRTFQRYVGVTNAVALKELIEAWA